MSRGTLAKKLNGLPYLRKRDELVELVGRCPRLTRAFTRYLASNGCSGSGSSNDQST